MMPISEAELSHYEHLAKHSLHLRKEASEIMARLIDELRSYNQCHLTPANGFFFVSSELMRECFQLPESVGIVGIEVDQTRREFRFSINDSGHPDRTVAEYSLTYERVPMDRRLKHIVRVTELLREVQ